MKTKEEMKQLDVKTIALINAINELIYKYEKDNNVELFLNKVDLNKADKKFLIKDLSPFFVVKGEI